MTNKTKQNKKKLSNKNKNYEFPGFVSFGFLFLTSLKACAGSVSPNALPTGYKSVAGDVQFNQNSKTNTLNISSKAARSIAEFNQFNVGKRSTVNFNLPGSKSAILGRVTGGVRSEIYGNINSNGQVFLVNPSGILFGSTAQINVSSLIASTLDISDKDFLKGELTFKRNGSGGAIVNKGKINVDKGGAAVLLGSAISNEGIVNAAKGQIHFAVGDQISVPLSNGLVVDVKVDKDLKKSLDNYNKAIKNTGTLKADNGLVKIQAKLAKKVYEQAVNIEGQIDAGGLANNNGVIEIVADGKGSNATVATSGNLTASSIDISADESVKIGKTKDNKTSTIKAKGGDINITAQRGDIRINDRVIADGEGNIIAKAKQDISISDGSSSKTNTLLASSKGEIELTSQRGDVNIRDRVSTSGDIDIDSKEGKVNISDGQKGNNAHLVSSRGKGSVNIDAKKDINVRDGVFSQDGKIDLDSSRGDINISDGSSSKTNTLLASSKGEIELTSQRGDVNIRDRVSTSGDIDIDSNQGEVNISDGQKGNNANLVSSRGKGSVDIDAKKD
ncbi:MAG: filamentous hemagglutinin N-terminal domain-containing protein, partial [Candidatus Caenarcaniphilales bacterium]|nr:filamentous hemagglutinin N-terminal domain-containing protein [Candidatus Caenarcaniphilales bacterium]